MPKLYYAQQFYSLFDKLRNNYCKIIITINKKFTELIIFIFSLK